MSINKKSLIIFISILIILPFLLCIGLELDEPFTMGLINNNYGDIIHLTSLDVHPPLYYIILKFYLQVTTFWTSNIFIKIVMARILSLIFSVFTFIFLRKMITLFKIKINKNILFLLFLVIPFNLGIDQQLAHIRMYSLSAMLITIQVYYIFLFIKKRNNNLLYVISIITLLSLYTNYFTGLISIMYVGSLFIYTLVKKEWSHSSMIFLLGIISLLLYLPWINIVIHQFNSYPHENISMNSFYKYCISFVFIFFIFSMNLIFEKYKKNELLNLFSLFSLSTLIVLFFINILSHSLSIRYLGPIFVPFILVSTVASKYNEKKLFRILSILFILISFSYSMYNQFKVFDIPSISFYKKFESLKKVRTKNISARKYSLDKYYWDYIGGNSVYLSSINKNISDKNYINTTGPIGNGNPKLFKAVFPNIEHFTTVNPSIKKSNNKN